MSSPDRDRGSQGSDQDASFIIPWYVDGIAHPSIPPQVIDQSHREIQGYPARLSHDINYEFPEGYFDKITKKDSTSEE